MPKESWSSYINFGESRLRNKKIIMNKEKNYIMKESVLQGTIIIFDIYIYILKQIIKMLKAKDDRTAMRNRQIITVRNINTCLSAIYRPSRQKISENVVNRILISIYWVLHYNSRIFFSGSHGIVSKINYILSIQYTIINLKGYTKYILR